MRQCFYRAGIKLRICFFVFAILFVFQAFPSFAAEEGTGKWHFDNGVEAYNDKDYDTAIENFKRADELDSSLEAEIHLYLGRIAINKKKWQIASVEISRAKEMGLSRKRDHEANIALAYILVYGDIPRRRPTQVASKQEKPYSFGLSISEDWIDGITLPLTVTTAEDPVREDDFCTKIIAGADYKFTLDENRKITIGYDLYQSLYADFSHLNFQGHTFSGIYNHKTENNISLTASYGFSYYLLDNDHYMNSNVINLNVFFPEKNNFYGKVGYSFTISDNKLNTDQDTNIHNLTLAQYYFIPDTKDFVSFGYVYGNSNPDLDRWEYTLHKLYMSGKHEFNEKSKITGYLSYATYDYKGYDTLETTKKRNDDILSFVAKYSYTVNNWSEVYLRYSQSNHNSNIIRQDYTSRGASLGTVLTW